MRPAATGGLFLAIFLASALASAQPRTYFKWIKRPAQVGEVIHPGFARRILARGDLRSRFERMLEKTRAALVGRGQLPASTPSREDSVFAAKSPLTWRSFLPRGILIRVVPRDPKRVRVLDHSYLDRAWNAWRRASVAAGSAGARLLKFAQEHAVSYWTGRPAKDPKPEVLIGDGATVVSPASAPRP